MASILTYGLRDGVLCHIDNVENGTKCACVCPACGSLLNARNEGRVRIHHFAHYKGPDCKKAQMTALHMMAQEVLMREKKVMLPEYSKKIHHDAMLKVFQEFALEKSYTVDGITLRPDCVGTNKGGELWIELKVTHEVDDFKRKEIKKIGKYCIEIDLNHFLEGEYLEKGWAEDDLIEFLTNSPDCREWINCPIWDRDNEKEEKILLRETFEIKGDEYELISYTELNGRIDAIIIAWAHICGLVGKNCILCKHFLPDMLLEDHRMTCSKHFTNNTPNRPDMETEPDRCKLYSPDDILNKINNAIDSKKLIVNCK